MDVVLNILSYSMRPIPNVCRYLEQFGAKSEYFARRDLPPQAEVLTLDDAVFAIFEDPGNDPDEYHLAASTVANPFQF